MTQRVRSTNVVSSGEIGQLSYNEAAHAARQTPVGASWLIVGSAATATVLPGPGYATVMLANTGAAWHYAKFGIDNTVSAPAGITDGLPIPPNSIMYYQASIDSLALNNLQRYIICDSAAVGVYVMVESTAIIETKKT